MPEEQIKELLSKDYLGVIASRNGYKRSQPLIDNGVDVSITYPSFYEINGHKRILHSGHSLDFQLKATTESIITVDKAGFYYDLKVNNYNDLIIRRDNSVVPLILVIFILPDDTSQWANIDIDFLKIRKNAYWYYPDNTEKKSTNIATHRIFISYKNRITINFLDTLIEHFYQ